MAGKRRRRLEVGVEPHETRKAQWGERGEGVTERPETPEEWVKWYGDWWMEARKWKDEEVDEGKWDEYEEAWNNEWQALGVSQNLVYALGKVVVPMSTVSRPRVVVTPFVNPQLWFHCKVLEKLVNLTVDGMDLGESTKKVVMDVFLCGRGFLKVGFDGKGEGKKGVRWKGYSDLVKKGMPWALRVDPRDVWVIGGEDWNDARYVFHRIYRPWLEVQ